MEEYKPEIGQMCFGQPYQHLECPEKIKNVLIAVAILLENFKGVNPFNNNGKSYVGQGWEVHAYNWEENVEQKFNFRWKDVEISWYKFLCRGTTINREMSDEEIKEMVQQITMEILDIQ